MSEAAPNPHPIDLAAYLERIDYAGELFPSLPVLEALHLAHATHIPFENLDVLLGKPIRLDLAGIQEKLVAGGRGGYCFEQNLLFAAALEAVGFRVEPLAARVRYGAGRTLPRTHMTLRVIVDGEPWLADVGFGAEGLLLPVPLVHGREVNHFAWTYRVMDEGPAWALQSLKADGWFDLYAFTLEPQLTVDYEVANHYVSTHPDSRFVQTLTVQLPAPAGRRILKNRELLLDHGDRVDRMPVPDDEALLKLLSTTFALHFPPGTRFPFTDGAG